MLRTRGSFINDVTQIWDFSDPPFPYGCQCSSMLAHWLLDPGDQLSYPSGRENFPLLFLVVMLLMGTI